MELIYGYFRTIYSLIHFAINSNTILYLIPLGMDRYNLFTNKTYDENVIQLHAEMAKQKDLITRIKERFLYKSFVRQRLNAIKYNCSETMHKNKILTHFTTRTVLQAYVMIRHEHEKIDFHHTLKCFDLCHIILRFANAEHKEDFLEDLFNCCPSFYWEQRIKNLFYNGKLNLDNKAILEDLMHMCSYDLVNNIEFKSFLRDLYCETKTIKEILILMKKEQDRILNNI